MRIISRLLILVLFCGALAACATTPLTKSQVDAQRSEIMTMRQQTLDKLYQQYPQAKEAVEKAAGYAVFANFGMKILFMGGAGGHGVAIDNASKQATYMKMAELQPGLGLGAQNFGIIFIFAKPAEYNKFITSGWDFGANAMASAQSSTQGGGAQMGATVAPGVTMYQLSDQGAIVGVSVTAAKYYQNKELN